MNIKQVPPTLNVIHPEALVSLGQEYHTAFQENFEKTKTLKDFRDEYKVLKSHLQKLPDKICHDALIPLGTKALAYGTIIHTNEILCLLGDNYFLECSAKSAAEMVDRRIKRCDELLNERHQEGERLEHWKSSITKLILETGEKDTMEIVEEIDDEKYNALKIEHRENVRRYKQALALEKQKESADQKKEEDEFWARLEARELEEDMMRAEEEKVKRLQNKGGQDKATTSSLKKKVQEEKERLPSSLKKIMEENENLPSTSSSKTQNRVRFNEELSFSSPAPFPSEEPPETVLKSTNDCFGVDNGNVPISSEVPRKVSLFKQRKTMMNDQ